eukprot:6180626-Pleurochrysis_carterae.AAC.2
MVACAGVRTEMRRKMGRAVERAGETGKRSGRASHARAGNARTYAGTVKCQHRQIHRKTRARVDYRLSLMIGICRHKETGKLAGRRKRQHKQGGGKQVRMFEKEL